MKDVAADKASVSFILSTNVKREIDRLGFNGNWTSDHSVGLIIIEIDTELCPNGAMI